MNPKAGFEYMTEAVQSHRWKGFFMRYSLLLLPMAALGLAGCVSNGAPATQRVSYITHEQPDYMTQGDSAGLIILPGDTTTEAQLRFLNRQGNGPTVSEASANNERRNRVMGLRQGGENMFGLASE
jgi:hypothetical protein